MRRKLSLTLVCAALLSMPANDATPFSCTFSVSVYAMRRKTFRPTLSSCLKKTQQRSENNHGNVPPRMQNFPFLNTHFHMCKKTHGLSRKIQGTYFKISALYFKIYALYFLPFQTSEKQRLMHTFRNPRYRLIFSYLRIFMSDCVISVKRCSIAITKFRFRTSA